MLSADLNNRLQRLSQLTKQRFRKKPVLGLVSFGGRTPEDVRREIIKLNARIASGVAKPIEKLDVLRHDLLFQEVAVLRTILSDALQEAIQNKDDKTKRVLEVELGWLDTFREDVHKHQIHCERNESSDETARIENTILTEYEQRKLTMTHNIETIVNSSRRGFLKVGMGIAAAAALGFAGEVYGQDSGVAKTGFEAKKAPLTEKNIEDLMKYETVEEVLKEDKIIPVKVEFVTYDEKTKTSNFDELVYQKNVKPADRKSVLLFSYLNKDPANAVIKKGAHRSAIVVKRSGDDFPDKLKIVCNDGDINPLFAANNYAGFLKQYGLPGFPCVSLYADHDILKNEKPGASDIKLIDICASGLNEDKYILPMIRNFENYWLATNVFSKQSPKKDRQVYRFGSTIKLTPVGDAELSLKE